MIGFATSGAERPSSQLDDVLRRQFLDRLADVQVACWGADATVAAENAHGLDGTGHTDSIDPMLSATPESVLIGLARQLNNMGDGSRGPATAMPTLSDDHYATWDRLDKNRELLGVAKTFTLTSQNRARHAMMSAGLVGCGVFVSVVAIVWLVWSSLEGQAATAKPAELGSGVDTSRTALLQSTLQQAFVPSPIQENRNEKPAGAALVSSLTASALAGRFAQPKTEQAHSIPQPVRQYLSLLTHIDVSERGEAPLKLRVHDPKRDLAGAYIVLGNVPSGIVPTVGDPGRDGRWTIQIAQLSELNLVLGAAPPNTFDLSVAIHAEAGQVLSELGMTVVLKYPQHSAPDKTDRQIQLSRTLRPKTVSEAPPEKPASIEPKNSKSIAPERNVPSTKATSSKTEAAHDDAPRPKAPMRPKPRQIEALDTSKQMGVGVEVVRSQAKRVVPPSVTTGSGETWWKKPLPEWSRSTGVLH
jgi:hypothetical protein